MGILQSSDTVFKYDNCQKMIDTSTNPATSMVLLEAINESMRKYVFLLCLIALNAFLGCERKCSLYADRPLSGKINEYFGVYKPGNWWTYKNQTGIKIDSQYVEDYSDVFDNNRTVCERIERRNFKIINTQFLNGAPLYVTYEAGGSGISVHFSFVKGSTQSASFPQFIYFLEKDSIISYEQPGYGGINTLDSISLNGKKYYDILLGGDGTTTYFFAKNNGLVGWGNILDTFQLVSFKIL